MLTVFKPVAETVLRPVAKLFGGVNPHLITLTGLVFPVVFLVLLIQGRYGWALAAFVFNLLDMLDGMVARTHGKVTRFGALLDSTIDRFADFTLIAAFGFAGLVRWEIVAPLLLLTYLISYIRSRTELAARGELVASVGLIERTERLTLVFLGLMLQAGLPDARIGGYNLISAMFLVLIALSALTVLQRLYFAYKKL